MDERSEWNHIARHIAAAVEETPVEDTMTVGRILEIPGHAASPEVIEKLKALGIQVAVANRKKRLAVRAAQRRSAEPLQRPRVFVDGTDTPDERRKCRNKNKARRRKQRAS